MKIGLHFLVHSTFLAFSKMSICIDVLLSDLFLIHLEWFSYLNLGL